MIYFTLPNTNNSIYKYIDCIYEDEVENHEKKTKLFDISNSLSFYLYEMKNKIKKYEREWDIYKKYTNPYEFINTIIPGKNKCIAKYKPLSRSYFKMIELLHFFFLDEFVDFSHTSDAGKFANNEGRIHELSTRGYSPNLTPKVASLPEEFVESIPWKKTQHSESEVQGSTGHVFGCGEDENKESKKTSRKPIHSFHLAEGPGGFIEALANTRNNPHDVYVGITILESRRGPNVINDVNGPNPTPKVAASLPEEFVDFSHTKGVEKITHNEGRIPKLFEKEKYPVPNSSTSKLVPKDGLRPSSAPLKVAQGCERSSLTRVDSPFSVGEHLPELGDFSKESATVGSGFLDATPRKNPPDTCNKNNPSKQNKSVPGWKKSDYFLKSHPNIHIETGADKTGNILSIDNFLHCRAKYGSTMDLITGDGGFDFSADFNNQEMNITQLLFAQMCYALCLQKHNGSFILKIFDCFMEHTVDILYILSAFYETVYITKPKTSRYANSEKYLVCKNFLLFDDSSVFPCLKMAFQKMLGKESGPNLTSNVDSPPEKFEHKNICRFLKIPIPAYYIYKLEEYNTIYGQQQIENIYQTIVLIEQINLEQEDKELRCGNNTNPRRAMAASLLRSEEEFSFNDKTEAEFLVPSISKDEVRRSSRAALCVGKDDFSNSSGSEAAFGVRLGSQSPKINNLIRTHLRKCVHWCLNHNIPYNIMDD